MPDIAMADTEQAKSGVRRLWRWVAAAFSGLLLALSFPPFESASVAWVALIPLLVALLHPRVDADLRAASRSSFFLGLTAGLVFWLVSMSWMLRLFETSPAPALLIMVGWGLLSVYCALYFGAFAMTVAWVAGKLGTDKLWKTLLLTVLIPVLWVGGEMARSVWLTGFPWNLLGVSQYRNLVLIQGAQWVGVPGISALVMLANTGLTFTVMRHLPPWTGKKYRPHLELFIVLMTIALCFRAGMKLVRQHTPAEGGVSIAAIQPAIPQVKKWSQEQIDFVHSTFRRLTGQALAEGPIRPDLVIWPETATPYCVTEPGESRELVSELSRRGVPLLVGSMDMINLGEQSLCFNSSFLFQTNGVVAQSYNKQHLVPFGEYIPLSGLMPALAGLAPMGWNCTPGREATVFTVGKPAWTFSVLICFEDIMSDLSRAFVSAGARLLVNQTNDGWFDRSAGPVQHMSHCVFRCVENRVPAVRVANSGITCLIEPSGRIIEPTRNEWGQPPESLVARWEVAVPGEEFEVTPYTRHGDWLFGIPCSIVAGVFFSVVLISLRRRK
jgi:apolipoprotein N-acyltransferase